MKHIEVGSSVYQTLIDQLGDEPGSVVSSGDMLVYRNLHGHVEVYRFEARHPCD